MTKHIFIALLAILFFTGVDCKDEPPVKDDGKTLPDTTSHNFTFYVDTLGDGSSSVLFDVAIVNDSLIYAVGEIYRKDSTGEFENHVYNYSIWNGKRWSAKQLPYNYQGTLFYSPIHSLLSFDQNDIWFGFGNLIHWDGGQFQEVEVAGFQSVANKLWGISSDNIIVIGNNGLISRKNGNEWQQIPTGTTFDFKDIWGDKNPITGEYEIYAVASKGSFSTERKIYRINGTTATEVSADGIQYSTNAIWFKSQKQYYAAGGGMWKKDNILSNIPWQSFESGITPYYIYSIRGQSENDIVAVGSFGELLHYNGRSWKSFRDLPGFHNLELYAVDIKGNVICAVGYIGSRACVVRGYRK